MSEIKKRILSPASSNRMELISPRAVKIEGQFETRDLAHNYVTNFTEEQSIINSKAKSRVLEVRMSRFAGFKSPHILLSKLIDNQNSINKDDLDAVSPFNGVDAVQIKEKIRMNRKIKFKEFSSLSL